MCVFTFIYISSCRRSPAQKEEAVYFLIASARFLFSTNNWFLNSDFRQQRIRFSNINTLHIKEWRVPPTLHGCKNNTYAWWWMKEEALFSLLRWEPSPHQKRHTQRQSTHEFRDMPPSHVSSVIIMAAPPRVRVVTQQFPLNSPRKIFIYDILLFMNMYMHWPQVLLTMMVAMWGMLQSLSVLDDAAVIWYYEDIWWRVLRSFIYFEFEIETERCRDVSWDMVILQVVREYFMRCDW